MVTVKVGTATASAEMLLRIELAQDSNREHYPAAGVVMLGGTLPGWTGSLVYLCDTLAGALALSGVYLATDDAAPATITGHDADVDAWGHVLAGDLAVSQDATLNGVAAPWLVTVPVAWKAV